MEPSLYFPFVDGHRAGTVAWARRVGVAAVIASLVASEGNVWAHGGYFGHLLLYTVKKIKDGEKGFEG